MKYLGIILFFFGSITSCFAQDRVITLKKTDFKSHQRMLLAPLDGWVFKRGNDAGNEDINHDTSNWIKMNPTALTTALADETGRVEGWFRIKLKLDNSLSDLELGLSRNIWAASDVYINGKLIHSFGKTGDPFEAYNPIQKYPIPISLEIGKDHVIALHVVTYETIFTQREIRLKPENLQDFITITGAEYNLWIATEKKRSYTYGGICIGISVLFMLLFWLLLLLNKNQKIFWLIAILSSLVLLLSVTFFYPSFYDMSYEIEKIRYLIMINLQGFLVVFGLLILEWVLTKKMSRISIFLIIVVTITSVIAHLFSISWPFGLVFSGLITYFIYLLFIYRKNIRGAELAIIAAILLPTLANTVYLILHKYARDVFLEYHNPLTSLTILGAPFMLMVYISMRFKEVLKTVEEEARKVLKMTEEKKRLLANQNVILEQRVKKRTSELNTSLENLKSTQNRLIQSEKMASLGELTAGIAHEIQNPLNFVNNFSEVSNELIDEMNEEIDNGDFNEVRAISADIKQNLEKINHHGKRADSIVKGMLQHSRSSSDKKEPTHINKLVDEYFRLAYHGLRAKDQSFNAILETDYDVNVGQLDVIPQDLGRVILNLITNAFYTCTERSHNLAIDTDIENHSEEMKYIPTVSISTKKNLNTIEIKVTDNGDGMDDAIKEKIFQPFFTTKPTGQGTGLGLSMSYDIITKSHDGELEVETRLGKGTTFTIRIPIKN